MIELTIRIDDKRIMAALNDPELIKGPIRDFLLQSGLTVEGAARMRAPVDTGRLRNSITTELEKTRVVVGSNLHYAPHVEFGTRPHWPPLAAMQPWARRHGFPAGRAGAFLVARAIARRGTKAQPYMRPALEASRPMIEIFLDDAGREIERRWQKHG